MPEALADLADVVAAVGARLRLAGLPVGTDRCDRFARALTLVQPATVTQLRSCAHATLAGDREQQRLLDAVIDEIFGGLTDPADHRGDPNALQSRPGPPLPRSARQQGGSPPDGQAAGAGEERPGAAGRDAAVPSLASAAERLTHHDFGDLTDAELASLHQVLASVRFDTPPRRSRRSRRLDHGELTDLRATLRSAHRSGGDPVRVVRRRRREKPRRLVVLCDISGSMRAYTRAMLTMLYAAHRTGGAEVFTFATRLTRLTPALSDVPVAVALRQAGLTAPDWAGGTRIAAALKEFIDRYGRRGLARGAVVVIVSDGWETGDPADLGVQMRRLSDLAYRVVWVNPRTAGPDYRPLVGGMAAAWPYCDAVVSAHRLSALADLSAALADPVRRRVRSPVRSPIQTGGDE